LRSTGGAGAGRERKGAGADGRGARCSVGIEFAAATSLITPALAAVAAPVEVACGTAVGVVILGLAKGVGALPRAGLRSSSLRFHAGRAATSLLPSDAVGEGSGREVGEGRTVGAAGRSSLDRRSSKEFASSPLVDATGAAVSFLMILQMRLMSEHPLYKMISCRRPI
jgi:hypothetical protein